MDKDLQEALTLEAIKLRALAKEKVDAARLQSDTQGKDQGALSATKSIDGQTPRGGRRRLVKPAKGEKNSAVNPKSEPKTEPKMEPVPASEPLLSEEEIQKMLAELEKEKKRRESLENIRKFNHWTKSLGGVGELINVKRSSGEMENGWKIDVMNPETGIVTVKKPNREDDPNGPGIEKGIPIDELMEWNSSTQKTAAAVEPAPVLEEVIPPDADLEAKKSGEYASGQVYAEEYLKLFPPRESGAAEAGDKEGTVAKAENEVSRYDEKIAGLKKEVESLRKEYVKADYNETNAWARVKKFFGSTIKGGEKNIKNQAWQEKQYKKEENQDGVWWQAQYQNKLFDLKNAQLALIKERAVAGEGWKEQMADMVKYFGIDEVTKLIDARTEYRAGEQNWPTKVFDSFGALGREYNKLSMKQKLVITAVCAGGAIVLALPAVALSGGTAAGVIAGLLMGAKRVVGAAGMAVGTEALLDSSRTRLRGKETEKDIKRLDKEMSTEGFASLEDFMKRKAFGIDDELQKAKLTKLLHKTGALAVGVAVGSGWLTQIVMDHWGGNELIGRAKEHLAEMFSKETTVPPVGGIIIPKPDIPLAPVEIAPEGLTRLGIEGGDMPLEPEDGLVELGGGAGGSADIPAAGAPGAVSLDGPESAHGGVPKVDPGFVSPVEPGVATEKFNDLLNGPYEVQKGDSIWKIIEARSDALGLEGAQKTDFIDALKDKVLNGANDFPLMVGQEIDFSQYFDADDIQTALDDAKGLSSETMASIDANDLKIADYVQEHPGTHLTHSSVDEILHGNATAPVSTDATLLGGDAKDTLADTTPDTASGAHGTITAADADESFFGTADIRPDDIRLGTKYDVKAYTEFFKANPEAFTQYKEAFEAYFGFIFQGDQDAMKAIGKKTFSELKSAPNESFEKFVNMARESYGKFGMPQAKEKIYAYIARMAMLGMEPSAKHIILPRYF